MKKLFLAIIFITITQLLPLLGKPFLILNYKNIIVMFANAAVWLTQPPVTMKETLSNKQTDKFSVLLIILMSMFSIIVSVTDWAYFKDSNASNIFFTVSGIVLLVTGILFRIWAIEKLGKHFTPTVQSKKEQKLITSGPYSVIRHPSYLGAFTAITGTGVLLNSIAGSIISFSCMLYAYYVRILLEEKALTEQFGKDYENYRSKTKKLIPFIW